MENLINDKKYEKEIRQIQRIESILVNVTRVLTIAILVMMFPLHITLPTGKVLLDHDGLSFFIAFPLIVLCYVSEIIIYSKLITPKLFDPLVIECDPEKYLAINMAAARPRIFRLVCATSYVYLGNYSEAVRCANDAAADKNVSYSLNALYHRAYAEFLQGDYAALRMTKEEFSKKLVSAVKMKDAARKTFLTIEHMLSLLIAIGDGDPETINDLKSKITPNDRSKASMVSTKYFLGLAALTVGDLDGAKAEFEWIKENDDKTVFSSLAKEKLENLIS